MVQDLRGPERDTFITRERIRFSLFDSGYAFHLKALFATRME